MIGHNKSNIVECQQIKTNELFGLDWTSRFKMNIYFSMLNSAKNM